MKTVISDFGGVLTTPLSGAFDALHQETGVALPELGAAMKRIAERDGEHPLFELERGRVTEADFTARLALELGAETGDNPDMSRFGEIFIGALSPNPAMIDLMGELRDSGHRLALLTNNVREWQPHWMAKAPIEELFELVVDSAFVDCRKPEPEIYKLTLERLGVGAGECIFVDDLAVNCEGAAAQGMTAIQFRDNSQAIEEIRAALAG